MPSVQPLCERIDLDAPDGRGRLEALRGRLVSQGDMVSPASRQRTIDVFGAPLTPRQVVERICADVRERGLAALLDYTRRIDGVEIAADALFVPAATLAAAHREVEPEFLAAVRRIAANVERFQRALLARDVEVPLAGGGVLRQRYLPLDRVGVCVPGGAAAYPSTLLMTVVPARVAGVGEIVVVAPPTKFGAENRHVLATCHELGVTTVVRAGAPRRWRRWPTGSRGCAAWTRSSAPNTSPPTCSPRPSTRPAPRSSSPRAGRWPMPSKPRCRRGSRCSSAAT